MKSENQIATGEIKRKHYIEANLSFPLELDKQRFCHTNNKESQDFFVIQRFVHLLA